MKQIIVAIIVVLAMPVASMSQNLEITPSNYEQFAQRETAAMTIKLSLSSGQADSVSQINKNYYYKIAGLRGQQLNGAERTQKLQLFKNEWQSHLSNNLSADQYNRFLEEREQVKRRMDSLRVMHHHN